MAELERVNLVVTGHVDHGKSTGLGHMLFLLGQIHDPKKNREAWRIAEKYYKDSKNEGMASWTYAWITQPLMDERARGLTINISFQEFKTKKYVYNLIDAPGHSDFVKNMITGASQADAAILVVSARKGEFEDGTKSSGSGEGKYQNVIGMTTEHMLLLVSLGVTDIAVAVNKMDAINWDKARYEQVKGHISKILTMLMKAVKIEDADDRVAKISFVPTSGLLGINMIPKEMTIANLENHIKLATAGKADPEFIESLTKELAEVKNQWPDWYTGPTLLDALDNLPSPAEKKNILEKQSLRVPIQSSLNISGIGTVLTGRVASGILKAGDKIVVAPTKLSNQPTPIDVKSVQEFHKEIPSGTPGDNIGFNIKSKNLGAKDILKGAVVSAAGDPAKVLLPNKDGFLAMVLVVRSLGKKGKSKDKEWSIHKEYAPVIHVGTAQVTCRVTEMKDLAGQDIDELKANQRGMLWFTPVQPVVVEPLTKTSALGRFAIRDSGKTVAVGIVEKIETGRYETK